MKGKRVTIIGLGKFGASILEGTTHHTILVDWRNSLLKNTSTDIDIKVRKRSKTLKEIARISKRLASATENTDIAFVVVNTAEKISRDYATEILSFLKDSNVLTIAIVLFSSGLKGKVSSNQGNLCLKEICNKVATVAIPSYHSYFVEDTPESEKDIFDSLGNYSSKQSYFAEVLNWNVKLKAKEIRDYDTDNTISRITVANAAIEKVLKMLNQNYINSTSETVENFFETPGKLHIASAHSSLTGNVRYSNDFRKVYTLERKIAENDLIGTFSTSVSEALLHLTIPSDLSSKELEYLCSLPSRKDWLKVKIAITTDDTLRNIAKAEVIGADAKNEDDIKEYIVNGDVVL